MVKIKVAFNTNAVEHDLNRDQPLSITVSALCAALGVNDNPNDYMLQNATTFHYVTQAVRGRSRAQCHKRTSLHFAPASR